MKDRCVDMFSVLSRADNGQIGWKKYAACWNSRVPVNFRASRINSRDVESGAVSLAFVCLVDFYLILTTWKECMRFFARLNYFSEICHHILILTCMSYEKISPWDLYIVFKTIHINTHFVHSGIVKEIVSYYLRVCLNICCSSRRRIILPFNVKSQLIIVDPESEAYWQTTRIWTNGRDQFLTSYRTVQSIFHLTHSYYQTSVKFSFWIRFTLAWTKDRKVVRT